MQLYSYEGTREWDWICLTHAAAALTALPPQHFERELRRFARHEREMVLNSHGLYNMRQV